MKCYVYKSSRRADTYVFISAREDFSPLPEMLREQLGSLNLVLELDLSPERRLAMTDAGTVMASITGKGYYLQLPPDQPAA
jgi:uncharacterized protein YcgL (UPF0745 family)